ncbi:ATP-binding protein [Streptomyces sp. DH37]|uniref:ATP-binding protein n=1 Tax=Streptomyces sp. DH37 TaxID=3040122 RepID=UPI00244171D6|nr:ATP-binding protein [Streptomyces sp. DH37]MDG9702597.1 ATP-binding protein [Streptomyces sp. DH37]
MEITASQGVGAPHLRAEFDGRPPAIARARDAADAFLAALARTTPPATDRHREDVLLVVSELVTNAVRHAPGPLTLCLALVRGSIQITVGDTNPAPPRPRADDLHGGTGGFGWPIVQRLAHHTEVPARAGGKEIHAFLPW